ncbi:MAG: chromosomal replication initiator protein DnaA [Oscillospiraceae bacterium]|nr:chromosomal replication initiator protein DnaA [Oscillospiraceae bacterium]
MQSATYIWAKVLNQLEERLSAITVSAWFDDAELVELNEKNFILYTPSDFRQETILRNCKQPIEEILREQFNLPVKLLVWSDAELEKHRQIQLSENAWKINPHFCFDSFVAGAQNSVPLKAAMYVADNPGDPVYNPLYYYGSPGVGKTHLLYSIANKVAQTHPATKIVYVKGDQFTNELVQAIQHSTTVAFKKKYREADILLVDDIQFIAGKESTQEEFFHTFNNLYEMDKQIVLTSDRPPKDMPLLENRLKGRFGEGVMIKIEPPDFKTRKQIIRAKALELHLQFDEDIIDYLSQKLCDNVRQIEGGLRKINAYKNLSNMPLDLPSITKIIADLQTTETCKVVTPDTIVRYVCRYYGIEESQLKGPQRSKNIAEPRQIAAYLIRELTSFKLEAIGKYFNRDHGTVHHSIKKVQELLGRKGSSIEQILQEIRTNIEANT